MRCERTEQVERERLGREEVAPEPVDLDQPRPLACRQLPERRPRRIGRLNADEIGPEVDVVWEHRHDGSTTA